MHLDNLQCKAISPEPKTRQKRNAEKAREAADTDPSKENTVENMPGRQQWLYRTFSTAFCLLGLESAAPLAFSAFACRFCLVLGCTMAHHNSTASDQRDTCHMTNIAYL